MGGKAPSTVRKASSEEPQLTNAGSVVDAYERSAAATCPESDCGRGIVSDDDVEGGRAECHDVSRGLEYVGERDRPSPCDDPVDVEVDMPLDTLGA
jgi:hypothetical protein